MKHQRQISSDQFEAVPFNITVLHVYAPTSVFSDEDIEGTLAKIGESDAIIPTGDQNARVDDDNTDWKCAMGKYGYGDRKERGEHLLEFATTLRLYICNTRFEQNPIEIEREHHQTVINCRTFQSADISSDHSLVLCNIQLRLKKLHNINRCGVSKLMRTD